VTPHGSPEVDVKRKLDFSYDEFETPRRSKRRAAQNVKYEESSFDSEDEEVGERVKVEDENVEDDDEYKPEEEKDRDEIGVKTETDLVHEVGDGEDLHKKLDEDGMELLKPAERIEIPRVVGEGEAMVENLHVDEDRVGDLKEVYRLGDPFKEFTLQKGLNVENWVRNLDLDAFWNY